MNIVGAIFDKTKMFYFFLYVNYRTLNFEGRSKKKSKNNLQGDPRYRI